MPSTATAVTIQKRYGTGVVNGRFVLPLIPTSQIASANLFELAVFELFAAAGEAALA